MSYYIYLGLSGLLLFWLGKTLAALRRNVLLAKASGLPYQISPVNGMPDFPYLVFERFCVRTLQRFPSTRGSIWPILFTANRSLYYPQRMREELGEAFLIVSPSQLCLNANNSEAVWSIMNRRQDFPKPTEVYGIVNTFGTNLLSVEGDDWKRHRKVMAPAFSEKGNRLVWAETLRQAAGLVGIWSVMEDNSPDEMLVEDSATGFAQLAFHVICGAGFGIKQLFEGENEDQLGLIRIPGFNTRQLSGEHIYTFKDATTRLLPRIVWTVLFPISLLKRSPFHKELMLLLKECVGYFQEIANHKANMIAEGVKTDDNAVDIMALLLEALQRGRDGSKYSYLSEQEGIGNLWIALFAGHETSASTLNFLFIFASMSLGTQSRIQAELDATLGSRSPSEWTYEDDMRRLYNSIVGASMNETLRLTPVLPMIPRSVLGPPQTLTFGGYYYTIPTGCRIQVDCLAAHRNPGYWPHGPSKLTGRENDIDEWVPERWLLSGNETISSEQNTNSNQSEKIDGLTKVSYEPTTEGLFSPVRGAYLPFADGPHACPGKRFSQVEIVAVIAFIFKQYSIELDVRDWATDAEVDKMSLAERKEIYQTVTQEVEKLIPQSLNQIALKLQHLVPLRIRKRGKEKFMGCFV